MKYEHLLLSDIESEILDLYDSDECATPYCHPVMVRLLGEAFGRDTKYCVALSESKIVAALPCLIKSNSRLPITISESLPFDCYAFPLLSPSLNVEASKQVLEQIYRSLTKGASIVRCFPPEWLNAATSYLATDRSLRVSAAHYEIFIKDFTGLSNEQTLLGSYHPHHRRQIVSSLKLPVIVSHSESRSDLEEFYGLLEETMGRVARAVKFPFDVVVSGGERILRAKLGTFYVARHEGRCCAGAFFLSSKRVTNYWLGATANDKKSLRPMFGIMHRAMIESLEAGVTAFELGAGPTEGLRNFKLRWGALPVPQPTYTYGARWAMAALNLRARLGSLLRA